MKRKRIVRTAEVTIETEEKTLLQPTTNRHSERSGPTFSSVPPFGTSARVVEEPLFDSELWHSTSIWCPSCRRHVEMVTPDQAAQLACVTLPTIYRWIEVGTVHFAEARGHTLICAVGLFAHRAEPMQRRTTSS